MEKKIYSFYVLSSADDAENVRYVGVTTKKVEERFSLHKYCALNPEKRGLPVHKWMYSKYKNGGNILVKKIDECDESVWESTEQYWISYYKNLGFNLMNLDKGGKGVITEEKRSKDSIQRSIDGHKKPVVAYYKDGTIFREFESINEAADFLLLKAHSAIGNCINGRSKSCKGYIWKYKNDNNEYKPIYQFNFDGTLVNCYNTMEELLNVKNLNYRDVLCAIKVRNEYLNYFWSFSKEIDVAAYKISRKYYVVNNNTKEEYYLNSYKEISNILGLADVSHIMKGNNVVNYKHYTVTKL